MGDTMDRSKWILAMGIVAIMLAVGVLIPANTDVEGDTPTADSNWYKSDQQSFDINDVGDLLAFAEAVNGKGEVTTDNFSGKTVNLRTSLDLSGISWDPIGNSKRTSSINESQTGYFSGTFNGNGYNISNLSSSGYVPGASSLDNTEFLYGLFGFTYNAKITNLTVSASIDVKSVTSGSNTYVGDSVAPLVGYGLGTLEITNVTSSGSVKANDAAAGVVGRFYGTELTMSGCTSLANVESNGKVGGVIAYVSASNGNQSVTVTDCTNGNGSASTGYVVGQNAGGIIGMAGYGTLTMTINGSVNRGKIEASGGSGGIIGYDGTAGKTITIGGCTNSGEIKGGPYAGGIIGISQSDCTISESTNSGNISSNDVAGGMIGSLNANTLTVSSSNVTRSSTISATNMAGGILGKAGGKSVTLDSCYVSANIQVTTTNISMTENQGTVYEGIVKGLAIGGLRQTQLTMRNMEETGGQYELISTVYFNSDVTVTLENCKTTTLMTWGGNSGTMDLVLKNSTIAGLEIYQRNLRITADATSTIGHLIAGADDSILGSGTPFTPSAVQITVAAGTNLRMSQEVTKNYNSTFIGESGSIYSLLTGTDTKMMWNANNEWTGMTATDIGASVISGTITTHYTSLEYAVSAAPDGATIDVLESSSCIKTNGKSLIFTGMVEHTPVTVQGVAATCEHTGLTDGKECSVCDAIIEEQQIIEKTEHQWDSGVITTQPTKDYEGVRTYTCSVCGTTKTESIPKLCTHVWDSGKVTSEPTCGTAGQKIFECVKCHQTKTEIVAATGDHSWNDGEDTGSGTIKYTCSGCGTTKTAKIESEKTEVVEDGVKTTTETQKTTEKSSNNVETVTETTTVSKEEDGKVTEKTETTKSTTMTATGVTTVESTTTVTEKVGEKVETSKSTTTTEDRTTVVSETTVVEKGSQKTEETIAVTIESRDKSVKTEVSVSNGTTSGINTVITGTTGTVSDDMITSAVKQVYMATEAISDKVTEVSKTISVDTDNVTLSPTAFSAIASSGVSLTITGDAGSIGIDSSVAVTMTSQDEDVTISINEKKDGLTDAQKQKAGENKVIELSAKTATQDIHDLGGTAKVRIDMTGMEYKSPAVYWLQDDGTSVKVDAEFGDGYAAIELDHFSLYYIAETASSSTFIVIPDMSYDDFPGYVPTPSSDTTDSGSKDTVRIAVLVGAIVVVLVAMVALTHKSR